VNIPFKRCLSVQDRCGERQGLPLQLEQAVTAYDDGSACGPVGGSVARQLGDGADELAGGDACAVGVGEVAVLARHGVGDADPCRGNHVLPDHHVSRPELLGQLPSVETHRRDDAGQVYGDLQRNRSVQTQAEVVQDAPRVAELGVQLNVELAPGVRGGRGEVVHWGHGPLRREFHDEQ
jgi:hypothetical protein